MDPAQLAVLLGTIVTGFIGSGSLAMWRISRLEKRMDESSKDAREDRRRIYDKLDNERKEREDDRRDFDRLAGELRGKGYINGNIRRSDDIDNNRS